MAKKKAKKETSAEKDLEKVKENLEKTGEAVGDVFKGLFKSVVKVLDVAQEMEKKGEEVRSYRKEIKGVTKSGKEFQGESGWKIGFLDALLRRKKKEKKVKEDKSSFPPSPHKWGSEKEEK